MPWPDDPTSAGQSFENPAMPANIGALAPPPGSDPTSLQNIIKQLIPTVALGLGGALTSPIRSAPMIAGRAILGAASGYASAQPKPLTEKDRYYAERLQYSQMQRKALEQQTANQEEYARTLPDEAQQKAFLSLDAKGRAKYVDSRMARIDRQLNQNLLAKATDLGVTPEVAAALNSLDDRSYNYAVSHIIAADHKRGTASDPYQRGYMTAKGRQDADREAAREQAQGYRYAAEKIKESDPAQAKLLNEQADLLEQGIGKPVPKVPVSERTTAATRTMQEASPKVLTLANRVEQDIDENVKQLGPAASRWSEFMAGTVGAPNPAFTRLRTNVGLLSTLLMRMHVGARGGEHIMEHFKDLMNSGKQSPENLKAAIEEIKLYAQDVQSEGKPKGKDEAPAAPIATHKYNPATGEIEVK